MFQRMRTGRHAGDEIRRPDVAKAGGREIAFHLGHRAKALPLKVPPQLGSITVTCSPLAIEPLQVYLKRALRDPKDVRALPAQYLADEATAVTAPADNFLNRGTVFGQGQDGGVGLLPAQISSYCSRSPAVRRSGVIVAAPMALRIWRMDLRTASRKARLAFSMRCQRSATWVAWGRALAAARAVSGITGAFCHQS